MEKTKLAVRVPRNPLEGAKRYANNRDPTLTRLVSEFLRQLSIQDDPLADAPAVRSLSGTLSPMPRLRITASTWKRSMAAELKVLLDLDVILDVLQRREPFYDMSTRVLAGSETALVEGWVAAHSVITLFYLLARYQSTERARVALTDLLTFLSVAAVDQAGMEQALNLPYRNFEDAVQMMAAVGSGAQYLVTRNVRDYSLGPLPVLQPAELLALV